jgi:hypothetical protein
MKEELGLDHFEGRSWKGLHRHALMTMIAYTFLQHHRLQIAKREKRKKLQQPGPPKPTLLAVRRVIIAALMLAETPIRCPHCRNQLTSQLFNLPK